MHRPTRPTSHVPSSAVAAVAEVEVSAAEESSGAAVATAPTGASFALLQPSPERLYCAQMHAGQRG